MSPDPNDELTPDTGDGHGATTWLPGDFVAPSRIPIGTAGHFLRPIRPDDTELDMVAVMGSQARLWSMFGTAWGWPPATLTADADRADLARHAREMDRNESFNFALFDRHESALLGCVYIDPPEKVGADADVSWWVVDEVVGSELELAVDSTVPTWIEETWPFERPRFVGRDLTWDEWLELRDI